jgi:regulator of nucleoside diphosphate kinase
MMIHVHRLNGEVSDALQEFARRRVAHALQSLENDVETVDASVAHPERPGARAECRLSVRLSSSGKPVTITGHGADAYAAMLDATARLHESVSRAVGEMPHTGSPIDSPADAAQRPAMTGAGATNDEIVVTAMDRERLQKLIRTGRDARDEEAAKALADELDRARIVSPDSVTGNVVTMNSRVVFEDEATGESREVSLVYPQDSDPAQGRVSVLAPVGAALLGLSAGQTIDWPLPQGQLRRYRVVRIIYQPEAAGHFGR